MTPSCAKLIMAIGRCRVNVLVSGGTGSGKTTMLNCLTRYIEQDERIITCEDAAELQLQQPHVVRLETRPPNLEGVGQTTMRDLVRGCFEDATLSGLLLVRYGGLRPLIYYRP